MSASPSWLGGAIALAICLAKNAQTTIDRIAKICGGVVILLIAYVAIGSAPPAGLQPRRLRL